jgi:hypothetical protein
MDMLTGLIPHFIHCCDELPHLVEPRVAVIT